MDGVQRKANLKRLGKYNWFADRRRLVHKRFYAILRKYSLWKWETAPVSAVDWSVIQRELGEVSESERIRPSKRWSETSATFTCDVEIVLKAVLRNRPDLLREWNRMVVEETFGLKPTAPLPLKISRLRSQLAETLGRELLKRDIGSYAYWHGHNRRQQ